MDHKLLHSSFIFNKIKNPSLQPLYINSLCEQAQAFTDSGLADNDFLQQLFSPHRHTFHSRMFELSIFQFLIINNCKLLNKNHGPDFRMNYLDKTIWTEAISPTPTGLPSPTDEQGVHHFHHQECLLRITSAFKDKSDKFRHYIANNIVSDSDICIIAIDSGQLGWFGNGISQMPFVVEATYPVGPYAITFDKYTGKQIDSGHTYQNKIHKNTTNSEIPKDYFFSTDHDHISAILGAHCQFTGLSNICLVHNMNAKNMLPDHYFPCHS